MSNLLKNSKTDFEELKSFSLKQQNEFTQQLEECKKKQFSTQLHEQKVNFDQQLDDLKKS